MPRTYEAIQSTTLGSAAASITLSSIPATYTDLILITTGKIAGGTVQSVSLEFNGDTGTNYSMTRLLNATSGRESNRSHTGGAVNMSDTNQSDAFFHIMSYANTSVFKTVLAGSGPAPDYVTRSVALWRSTSAINSIKIYVPAVYNLSSGFTASLFGVKAA